MSDFLGAIFDGINQDKGMVYGLVNNAISYAQSKKAQKRAYQYAVALQQHQYNLTQQGYREGPSNQRQGLEDAGYNPMLALGNVGSPTNVSGGTPVGANAVDSPNLTGSALDLQRVVNETNATDASVELQTEQAKTEQAKRDNLGFQNAMLDVEKHLKQKDLDNYDRRFYTEMYKMMQDAEKARQEASVVGYNAESARIVANAQRENVNVQASGNPFRMFSKKAGEHLDSFVKDHPLWSNNPYVRFLHKTFN